jgi:hypothetical protein
LMIGNGGKRRETGVFWGGRVERSSGVPGRWRWARLPVVAAGLLLTERALVAAVGTPVAQAHALRSLGHGPVDPVAPLLAALALLAEALIGYVLAMLALRTLCAVTPSVGILSPQVHGKRGPLLDFIPRSGRIRTQARKAK